MRRRSQKSPWTTAGAVSRPREHHGPHVLDRTAGATTRERNRPRILQRYVVQQCVHAKGAGAKFIWDETHRQALASSGLRGAEQDHTRPPPLATGLGLDS